MRLSSAAVLALATVLAPYPAAAADEPLRVVSWGGSYAAVQTLTIVEPFQAESGIAVEVLEHDGGSGEFRSRAGPEAWDVIDMTEDQAIAACQSGLLKPLDHGRILERTAGVRLEDDFSPGSFLECSVAQNAFASVIAYDADQFPGVKPTRVEHFFDLESFPGKRAIQRSPDSILEWALMAEGVPTQQIYDLLSTRRGLRLAFRRLETIREAIVWWNEVAEPTRLLESGQVSMATGYNGRFFAHAHYDRVPTVIMWDGRIIGFEVWTISALSTRTGEAERFIRFATAPDRMARFAEHMPYGPTRRSAMQRIGLNPVERIPMRTQLPNAPRHSQRHLDRDSSWYASTASLRNRRFAEWLARE